MLKNIYLSATIAISCLVLSSCQKDYDTIQVVDENKIQEYIKRNNLTAMKSDPSGFYYQVANPGTGPLLLNKDSVFYGFDIKGLDGTVYQTDNVFRPNQNFVGYVTPTPLRTAMLNFARGGSATVIIPSYLAFGKNGDGNIPSNEIILVNLKTLSFAKRHLLDEDLLSKFNSQNNLGLTRDAASGCYYKVLTPGTGTDAIGQNSTITANYTVRYLDGVVIPQPSGQISGFLRNMYNGWRLNIPGRLTAGGKIRLSIPTSMGGVGEPLDFDIEIVTVTND